MEQRECHSRMALLCSLEELHMLLGDTTPARAQVMVLGTWVRVVPAKTLAGRPHWTVQQQEEEPNEGQ